MTRQPTAALARYVRTLASDPEGFRVADRRRPAALELGDAQAAAGFFARADEVNPRSPLPQAGMGAVSVANGEPQAALALFHPRAAAWRAASRPSAAIAASHTICWASRREAQADYRAALTGPDGDEARRRLALSLAISGDEADALAALAPLVGQGRRRCGAGRAPSSLRLTGDSNGAMVAINAAMPGSSVAASRRSCSAAGAPAGPEGGCRQPRHLPGREPADASLRRVRHRSGSVDRAA